MKIELTDKQLETIADTLQLRATDIVYQVDSEVDPVMARQLKSEQKRIEKVLESLYRQLEKN